MTRLEDWLRPRLEEAPHSLRERIMAAVAAGSGEWGVGPSDERTTPYSQLPDILRSLGESLMHAAKSGPPTRETAMTLLAADALITFAMEAEAEELSEGPTPHALRPTPRTT